MLPRRSILFTILFLTLLAPLPLHSEPIMVGTWEGQLMDPTLGMPVQVQLVIQPDYSYTCMAQSAIGLSRHWGEATQGPDYLRLEIEGGEPTEYCGPLGCNPIIWPEGETWPVQWIDDNSFQTTGGIMRRVR